MGYQIIFFDTSFYASDAIFLFTNHDSAGGGGGGGGGAQWLQVPVVTDAFPATPLLLARHASAFLLLIPGKTFSKP